MHNISQLTSDEMINKLKTAASITELDNIMYSIVYQNYKDKNITLSYGKYVTTLNSLFINPNKNLEECFDSSYTDYQISVINMYMTGKKVSVIKNASYNNSVLNYVVDRKLEVVFNKYLRLREKIYANYIDGI